MCLFILVQTKCVKDCMGKFIHLRISLTVFQFLDNDNTFLINCCNKVFTLTAKETLHAFHGAMILLLLKFQNHNNTTHICINMKFFRTIINVHQEQIIKKEILNKAVLVKSFLVCNDQILDLECSELSYHISIFVITMCHQYIF